MLRKQSQNQNKQYSSATGATYWQREFINMDLTAFSQENFDPKEWINNIFRSQEAQQNRDQYASSQVMRLQLAIQEVNNSLEDTSQQVISSLPRVFRDIESLGHEASVLREQMNNVRQDIEKVEMDTAASMQTLVKLDTLKSRLVDSSQALREADNWTTLSTDIEEVMDSGDMDAIAKKLVSLQSCLAILTHAPDYEERLLHLEALKVRLEALASPHIVAAFNTHNLEESSKYAKVFKSLGRVSQLESYYYKCEIGQLLSAWRVGVEGHQLGGPHHWLSDFYDKLSALITQQVKWCSQVFEDCDAPLLLSELIRSTLTSLDPPVSQVLAAAARQQDDPLAFLVAVKASTDQFLHDFSTALGVASSDKAALYESQRGVVQAAYQPLVEQIAKYQEYEEALLVSHLASAELMKPDMLETIQRLRDYCTRLSAQVEAAGDRCLQLTGGLGFPHLVAALGTFVEHLTNRFSQAIRHVEQQKTSIIEDWNVFTTCLNLIQATGELVVAVESAEHSLAAVFTSAVSRVSWTPGSSPMTFTPDLILNSKDIKKLKALITKVVDEDSQMLENCITLARTECEKGVRAALDTVVAPVSTQLAAVPSLEAWTAPSSSASHLSFSFSPQEYITQIGQYLMTLPQHLEPLLVSHSPALNRALQEFNLNTSAGGRIVSESEVSAAEFLINCIGQSTCKLYTDAILKIPPISSPMVTQLTTDIDYICNILEDLGMNTCDPLDKLNKLLKCPVEEYWQVVPRNNPRLVAAVRQMRHIPHQ